LKGVLGYGIGVGKGEVDRVLAVSLMRLKVCRNLFLLKVCGIVMECGG